MAIPVLGSMMKTISGWGRREAPVVLENMREYELANMGRPFHDLIAAEAAYGSSVWVYASVNAIAKSCARTAWKVLQGGEDVNRPTDPLQMLLARPNPFMSGYDLREALAISLALKGEAFILKDEMNGAGQPAKLWMLDPTKITVVPHPQEFVGGYVYTVNDRKIPFESNEIIHIKFHNPYDPFRGFGPTQALFGELNLEHLRDQYDQNFFRNGARLMGVIEVPDPIDNLTFDRMKHEWKSANAGVKNAWKTAVLTHGATYKNIGLNPKEIDHLAGRRLSRDKILAGYGVPPSKIGLVEDANRSNSDGQDTTFLRETVEPYTTKVSESLTIGLAPAFHPAYVIDFPGLVPDDYTAKAEYAERLGKVPGVRVNEVRQAAGLKPLDGALGDAVIVPNAITLADEKTPPAPPQPPTGPNNGQPQDQNGDQNPPDGQAPADQQQADQQKKKIALHFQTRSAQIASTAKLVKDDVRQFFSKQYDRIVERLHSLGRSKSVYNFGPDDVWAGDGPEGDALRELMTPWYIATGKLAMIEQASLLGTDPVMDFNHPKMRAVVDDMGQLITRVNDTTRQSIVEEVKEGMRRGYTLRQIAEGYPDEGYRGIRGVFSYADEARADDIARTETAMAYNRTSLASYDLIEEATGGVVKVYAVEVSDGTSPNSDPACQSVNGQVWTKDYADAHPVEHPNCVRGLIPLTEEPKTIHRRAAPGERCMSPYVTKVGGDHHG